jgi:zinc/manganese transport system ATP-binding protein
MTEPVARLHDATMRFGSRTLYEHLDLDIAPGEFIAVLGPNGTGKTTLLKVLLGLQSLTSGSVSVAGRVGYIPQQHGFDRDLPIRGRDLVALGLDGQRFGLPRSTRQSRARLDRALDAVDARGFANRPIGRCSGGEQQRLRVAQALIADPELLLCDEPLLSLDLAQQRSVSELINDRREDADTAVLFVTHEINPILPYVDRVLYLVGGRWAIGTPHEVLTSERLSDLYGTTIDVVEIRGRILVVGGDDEHPTEPHGHAHHHHHPDGHDH